jgi:triosephosphate isomerase
MKYFIANWKMNLTAAAASQLVGQVRPLIKSYLDKTEIIVCPSFTSLSAVAKNIIDSGMQIGAQNCSWQDVGSLTGEVSLTMLKEWGVSHVIVGHSERRQRLCESEEMINQKMSAVLKSGLVPILCVGETFSERQEGRKDFVIAGQVESALKNIQLIEKKILIAYEPVWVIGSGQAVKIDEAEHAARVIKQVLIDLYPDIDLKQSVQVLYGGSVDSKNISYFISSEYLSGVLVGGASLQTDEFANMVKIISERT